MAIAGHTLGDYLALATDDILLYGHTDPNVVVALSRLARTVGGIAVSDTDRRSAAAFADRVAAAGLEEPTATRTGGGFDGGGAVVGGVVMAGGEPGDVAAVADDQPGNDGTHVVDLSQ